MRKFQEQPSRKGRIWLITPESGKVFVNETLVDMAGKTSYTVAEDGSVRRLFPKGKKRK